MVESLKALLAEWKETRYFTLEFINELSDADLDKKLPRKKLNTIRLQAYEVTLFQKDMVESLTTKICHFDEAEYAEYKSLPKQALVDRMAELDDMLEKSIEQMDGTEMIEWFGEPRNIHHIFATMIGHEQMHLGQIIAFCYATGIEIPANITENMALEG
ncbi:MAG: DinB family protein [Firmicutes bacterium]|nr:DinB family protein [Bacillota bacterium]